MALKFVFCVLDSCAGTFSTPHLFVSEAEAVRAFTAQANNPETPVGQYPHDFALMYMGIFHDDNGIFELNDVPKNMGLATSFVKN